MKFFVEKENVTQVAFVLLIMTQFVGVIIARIAMPVRQNVMEYLVTVRANVVRK